MEVHRIAAVPGGWAVFSNKVGTGNQVLRLNNGSKTVKKLYKCDPCVEIGALLLLGQDLFVIHINGTIIQIILQNEQILNIYAIKNVAKVIHTFCLYSDPSSIDKELLLLTDQDKGEVFSYRLSSDSKQVHVRHLNKASSVSYYRLPSDNKQVHVRHLNKPSSVSYYRLPSDNKQVHVRYLNKPSSVSYYRLSTDSKQVHVRHLNKPSSVSYYRLPSDNKQVHVRYLNKPSSVSYYRLSTDSKQVHVRHLNKSSSVSYYFHYETIYFVVCDSGAKEIHVYDRDWRQVWSFQDHRFSRYWFPSAVVICSENTLIISVIGMNNISEFTVQGEFIRNLLSISSDNIYKVKGLSFYYPFFWVPSSRTFLIVLFLTDTNLSKILHQSQLKMKQIPCNNVGSNKNG